jgi:hypothetical protein
MAYARTDGETYAWLQAVGTRQEPVDAKWRHGRGAELLGHVWSTKQPRSWRVGDLIAYYASHWGQVIGVVEITGPPHDDNAGDGGQWRWRVPVCPLLVVGMDVAPTAAALELVAPRDYYRLPPDHYARLRDALAASAAHLHTTRTTA